MIDFRKSLALFAAVAGAGRVPAGGARRRQRRRPPPSRWRSSRKRRPPLDAYIAKPESVYGWKLVSTIPGDGYQRLSCSN